MKPYLLEKFSYPKLPILQRRNEIVQLINQNPVVLISGSTGSGKSCLVPQFILEDCFAINKPCRIVITQPRRIAASSLCRYVCKMLRVPVGTLVGYKVANDKMSSPETAITFVTTGVLLQQLVAEKNLESYSHIIIDEVHERDQNIDFILLILRKLLRTVSPHTKIIMMSATLQKNIFSDYFTCLTLTNQLIPALCIEIISQPHDIQVFYEDDINTLNRKQCQIGDENLTCQNQVSLKNLSKILHILDLIESYESGRSSDFRFNASCKHALLIFLPGLNEIEDAYSILMPHVSNNNLVLFRLHSQISNEDQQQIFRPMDPSFRKVILATNIAESSITIQDIVYVIDFCLTKQLCLNESTNYAQLQLQWASKASLEQRKGRSGRVQRGIVWRMCTESFYSQLPDYPVPEIQRCPLQQTILKAKLLDMGEPRSLLGNLLSPPSVNDIELSILRLKEIGALVGKQNKFDGDLTFIGEIMAKLPVDPTLSKLCVLGFVFGLLDECCTLAAILSIKSFFSFRINDKLQSFKSKFIWSCRSKSDLISHLNAYNAWFKLSGGGVPSRKSRSWCKQELLNEPIMSDVKLLKDNLMISLSKIGMNSSSGVERTHPCLVDLKQKTELLKFVIAGAFYPHYFQMAPVDRKLAEKTSNGRSPKSTIFLHGLPMNRGRHFEESLLNYARQFGNVKCIDFDCTKCFIEFSHELTPDFQIPNSVYFALKDRYS
ncbi:MAG: ATP-dependent RNA helicase tdrd9 [Marteilia pararefringens]